MHLDERTEQAAEAIAVLSGLLLAALIGVALDQWRRPPAAELLIFDRPGWSEALGYVLAGVIGEVLAETDPRRLLARRVPRSCKAAWPLTKGFAGLRVPWSSTGGQSEERAPARERGGRDPRRGRRELRGRRGRAARGDA